MLLELYPECAMSSYRVGQNFDRFSRGYKAGQTLTDADLSCWLPESAREQAIKELIATNKIYPVQAASAPAVEPVVNAKIWSNAR